MVREVAAEAVEAAEAAARESGQGRARRGELPGDYARRLAEAIEAADGGAGAVESVLGRARRGALAGE